jgi:hypothetical protein
VLEYGSAASRKPSPIKLRARITTITGNAGNINQGVKAIEWTFCVACNRTPQLIAGDRKPNPRKLNAVSLMIIEGIARVVAAIRWL